MILVVIIYAGNILVGKAINELSPFTITFFRLLVAFIILLPIGLRSAWKNRSVFFKYKKPFLIMTIAGITLFNTFIYGALKFTTATNVSVLEAAIPIATIILSAFLLKEKLKPLQWCGVILSFISALWVIMDGRVFQLTIVDWNIGDGIMIGAILSWALYSVLVKQYMHYFPSFAALLVMTGISLVLLLPVVLIEWTFTGIPPVYTLENMTGLLYLGIFPSFIALIFYNRSVALLGATQASVFLNFLPVVTMVGAYLWLDETITMMQIIGSFGVIIGVLFTTKIIKL